MGGALDAVGFGGRHNNRRDWTTSPVDLHTATAIPGWDWDLDQDEVGAQEPSSSGVGGAHRAVVEAKHPGGVVDDDREPVCERGAARDLEVKNGRKNVKSALYRPILSANRTRQRPTAVYAHSDLAQNGQNGGN